MHRRGQLLADDMTATAQVSDALNGERNSADLRYKIAAAAAGYSGQRRRDRGGVALTSWRRGHDSRSASTPMESLQISRRYGCLRRLCHRHTGGQMNREA